MNLIRTLGLTLTILCFLCGCETTNPTPASHPAKPTASAKPAPSPEFDRTTPPKMGMTKAQVRRLYGEPKFTSQSPRGEVWNYTFDAWKFHVPYYNMAAKMKTGTVTFNGSGHVCDYQWGQSRSMFMMGM